MLKTGSRSHWFLVGICTVLPLGACDCDDNADAEPWELTEPWPKDMAMAPDLALEPDMAPDMREPEPDMREPVVIPPEEDWEREVVDEVPRTQALNDRTSLDVGEDGTIWLGFHPCEDQTCGESWLGVAQRGPGADGWDVERVAPQRGTFGLVVYEEQPWAAYLDERNDQFRVAQRVGPGGPSGWLKEPMPVEFTGRYDGLDLTHDDRRMYVTFASDWSDAPVDLFARDMTRAGAEWIELSKLDVYEASAALERGLQADNRGNLFLVHRDGPTGPYGVARYRLEDNLWDRQAYFPDTNVIVSSMVAREDGDICMSSTVNSGGLLGDGFLELSCGPINDLRRDVWRFPSETVSSYSSLIEGRDGSLIIAFNAGGNTELRVARRYPDGTWDFRTVFESSSYGVSTAISLQNRLLISYYTCESDRCTLEMLSQPYD